MSHLKRNTLAYLRHCHVPGSSAPPGWEKFWWFAVCIQYDNQGKLQKKAPPILFGKNSRPADSFISENEGMNDVQDPRARVQHFCEQPQRSSPPVLISIGVTPSRDFAINFIEIVRIRFFPGFRPALVWLDALHQRWPSK